MAIDNNSNHRLILSDIIRSSSLSQPDFTGFGLKYVGSDKPTYHLDTAAGRLIIKNFLKTHSLSLPEFVETVSSLYEGETYDEITLAARLVEYSPKLRHQLNPIILDRWLSRVRGWAETDVLCQMAFNADDLLDNWPAWENIIIRFSADSNVHKRRASLVLLTKPLRQSSDNRLADLAFANVEKLKLEKDILITKAVSWILRSLVKHHSRQVALYLEKNHATLPKIAIREVSNKLLTGKKTIQKKPVLG